MERFALARELVLQAGAALRESHLEAGEIQHKTGTGAVLWNQGH